MIPTNPKNAKVSALLFLSLLTACGAQIVEFELDAGATNPDGGTEAPVDGGETTAPTITASLPLDGATDIALDTLVTATFSTEMKASTLDTGTFTVRVGGETVAGTVSYAGTTVTFSPAVPLIGSTQYEATITTGAQDAAGTPLAANHSWTFATVGTAPRVTATDPLADAENVRPDASLSVTFSTSMAPATITATTFKLMRDETPVTGTVGYAGNTATFEPTTELLAGTTYTATVTTGATDSNGTALAADYRWSFTTESIEAPTVTSTSPMNLAELVTINKRPTATFSEPMNPLTLTDDTFLLKQGLTGIAGTVSYDAFTNTATFTPNAALGLGLEYTATITTGAESANGVGLATDHVWTFTTAACSQQPIVLGVAGTFSVLAGSTVTNTGPTSVTGDLGLSPGSAVEGFPPGNVVGTQHITDPTAAAGAFDLTAAYNDAAGRTLCPVSVAGNIGGQTLAPGLYKSTGSLEVSSGDLTLDAQGDGEAVFIFQIASTLSTTAGRQVILAGGAKSSNVFWQVGTAATLATTTAFQGTIMADQAITLNTGATLNGRVLARIGAVSLDSNVIVMPAP